MIEEVRKAATYIQSGEIILYPTDTIWGIGCDAENPDAVERIYRIKDRSDNRSMLVLMNGFKMLENYLELIPDQAREILEMSKKPTTLIFPAAKNLSTNLLAEDGSVGIRFTTDPFCRKLIELTGKPLVSTSANISGEPSPSLFSEIKSQIKEQVDYVVNWRQNETSPSAPSAIVKIEPDGSSTLIRP